MNPISGSFDIIDESEYEMLKELPLGKNADTEFTEILLERGYAFETGEEEEKAIAKAYAAFNNEIENSQVQLMLVPTYGCNLACTYCFQHGIEGKPLLISRETVDAFFDYAEKNFSGKAQKPFITLFGGEPLINSPAQRGIISYIIDKCAGEEYQLSVVTNGYDLEDYISLLEKVEIKEIQITLDGSREIHDSRRGTSNKKGTFDRIVEGIQAAVDRKMPINLRSVVDLENIEDMVNLAQFLDSKGWLDLPAELFKTQIGRNYELFDCYAKPQHLMTQVELWSKFSALSKIHPVLAKFHRPDFKGIRHLIDVGEMYMASFDPCPACKTEWVFDLYGDIYGCTASCGRKEYLLGTYWPEVRLKDAAISTWKKRNVKSIPKCTSCRYDVICGGGCGVVAANENADDILSPDCRPVQELLELGIDYYLDDIYKMTDEGKTQETLEITPVAKASCCTPKKVTLKTPNKTEGCIICGKELIYLTSDTSIEKCVVCGKSFETKVKCSEGHYICDSCHSADILGKAEQYLINSTLTNPVELAENVFKLPGLNMHGPEYHSIVPAVIIAAWQNLNKAKDISKIREAIRRGRDVKGGSCGYHGTCGAATGAGIAVAIIEGTTPVSGAERGEANRATGYALIALGKHGGPRCCKREAITTIETFMKVTDYFNKIEKSEYKCTQHTKNKECIGTKCPYFPKAANKTCSCC